MSPPQFPVQVQKGNERLRYIRFLLHTFTQSTGQDCRRHSQPKSCRILRGVGSPTDQMESRLDVAKGQLHRGVEWIPEENLLSSCALSSDQFQSQLRHSWCPISL